MSGHNSEPDWLKAIYRRLDVLEAAAVGAKPRGCVCPPTSEQTCQGPLCPRKNHFAAYQALGPQPGRNG